MRSPWLHLAANSATRVSEIGSGRSSSKAFALFGVRQRLIGSSNRFNTLEPFSCRIVGTIAYFIRDENWFLGLACLAGGRFSLSAAAGPEGEGKNGERQSKRCELKRGRPIHHREEQASHACDKEREKQETPLQRHIGGHKPAVGVPFPGRLGWFCFAH